MNILVAEPCIKVLYNIIGALIRGVNKVDPAVYVCINATSDKMGTTLAAHSIDWSLDDGIVFFAFLYAFIMH